MGCLVVLISVLLLSCGPIGWVAAAVLIVWYGSRSTAKKVGKELKRKSRYGAKKF